MSTDHLDHVLAEAGADLRAASRPDVGEAWADLTRRRRRRTTGRVVAAVATVAVTAALAGALALPLRDDRAQPARPAPAPTRVSLEDAEPAQAQVLARLRATSPDPDGPLAQDRFEGLTADGLVVRARGDGSGGTELGLLDPGTGRTSWLPPVPWALGTTYPVDLAAERLAYVDLHVGELWLMTFDRVAASWSRVPVTGNDAISSKWFGDIARLGPDDRVYFLSGNTTITWWSVRLATGGAVRPEPELGGRLVAFGDGAVATTDATGEVVVERDGTSTTVADGPPEGCSTADVLPPTPSFAGSGLLVSWQCGDEDGRVTAYDASGRPVLEVRGGGPVGVVAATSSRALLLADAPGSDPLYSEAYVLDLTDGQLHLLGTAGPDWHSGLRGDVALWPKRGPSDDAKTWDVVYSVVRVPS